MRSARIFYPYCTLLVNIVFMRTMIDDSPSPRTPELRWSQEARLRAIDLAAFWEGRVNRAELTRRFGISVPQATNDLRDYQARAPRNLRYDTRNKAYLADGDFRPLFGAPSAEAWLMDPNAPHGLPAAVMPMPARRLDPWLLRRLGPAGLSRRPARPHRRSLDLPALFICENNGYSMGTPVRIPAAEAFAENVIGRGGHPGSGTPGRRP